MANWNVTDASFKGLRFHVATPKINFSSSFGMTSQEVTNERRLQISEKALIDGAQIEDFGRKARTFQAEVIFFGSDYSQELKDFESKLNEGTSGKLILPDLSEAVYAKYQKHTRKTSAQDGTSTLLSVSWVEDITKQNILNDAILVGSSSPQESSASLLARANDAKDKANAAALTLENNPVLRKINDAQHDINLARVKINSVTNAPRVLRDKILNTVNTIKSDLEALKESIQGLRNLTDNLNFNEPSPLKYVTTLGAVDYNDIGVFPTTQVLGAAQVVVSKNPPAISFGSYDEVREKLQVLVTNITVNKRVLENQTSGATIDYSKSSVTLINSVKDLIIALSRNPTKKIMTTTRTSLLEVCFDNGRGVAEINDVYRLNLFLDDIMNIPPYTVISL